MKELLRTVIYSYCLVFNPDGVFRCEEGSHKERFFRWLYGEPEYAETDGWIYPE